MFLEKTKMPLRIVFIWQQGTETKVDVCVEDETTEYLNRKDVQTALHARLVDGNPWAACTE